MAHKIFLKRDSHTNVCSAAIVLPSGSSFFRLAGWYDSLQDWSLWLRMCKLSIIFWIDIHALFQGAAHGKGFLVAFRPSKWHMLS